MISIGSSALEAAQLAATLARLDAGSGNARLRLYSTTFPAVPGGHSDTPMTTLVFPKPCGSVSGGALTLFAPPAAALVMADGLPRWAELVAADGALLHIGDVTDAVGDGFYKASGADTPPGETSPSFQAGGLLSVGSIVLT